MRARDVLPPFEPSYSVDEFATSERLSRVALYKMWKQGKGPRFSTSAYYATGHCLSFFGIAGDTCCPMTTQGAMICGSW